MKNPLVEMNIPEEVPVTRARNFSIPIAVAKLAIIGVSVFSIMFVASAMTQDTTLAALEKNYTSSLQLHDKQTKAVAEAMEMERSGADLACNNYRALKAYKESKGITLTGDGNPCVQLNAPQEGF